MRHADPDLRQSSRSSSPTYTRAPRDPGANSSAGARQTPAWAHASPAAPAAMRAKWPADLRVHRAEARDSRAWQADWRERHSGGPERREAQESARTAL